MKSENVLNFSWVLATVAVHNCWKDGIWWEQKQAGVKTNGYKRPQHFSLWMDFLRFFWMDFLHFSDEYIFGVKHMFDYYVWDGGDIDSMHRLVTACGWLSFPPRENPISRPI